MVANIDTVILELQAVAKSKGVISFREFCKYFGREGVDYEKAFPHAAKSKPTTPRAKKKDAPSNGIAAKSKGRGKGAGTSAKAQPKKIAQPTRSAGPSPGESQSSNP